MNSKKRLATSNFCVAVAALLCIALPGGGHAATQQPAVDVQDLDAIWAQGKSLSHSIADAENEFFRLYNSRNKSGSHHISCGYVSLSRDSMIMTRSCAPSFIAANPAAVSASAAIGYGSFAAGSATVASAGSPASGIPATATSSGYSSVGGIYTPSVGSICSTMTSMVRQRDGNGETYYISSGCSPVLPSYAQYRPLLTSTGSWSTAGATEAMLEARQRYVDNVTLIVGGDPQLQAKAMDLAVLYREMEAVQQRYVRAMDARPGRPVRNSSTRSIGPRL